MIDGIIKEHQIHWFRALQVIITQLVHQHLIQFLRLIDADIVSMFVVEITEQYVSNGVLAPLEL